MSLIQVFLVNLLLTFLMQCSNHNSSAIMRACVWDEREKEQEQTQVMYWLAYSCDSLHAYSCQNTRNTYLIMLFVTLSLQTQQWERGNKPNSVPDQLWQNHFKFTDKWLSCCADPKSSDEHRQVTSLNLFFDLIISPQAIFILRYKYNKAINKAS